MGLCFNELPLFPARIEKHLFYRPFSIQAFECRVFEFVLKNMLTEGLGTTFIVNYVQTICMQSKPRKVIVVLCC